MSVAAIAATSCGHAETPSSAATGTPAGDATAQPPAATAATRLDVAEALCRPSNQGFLTARLQGAIDADVDWRAPAVPQCIGGPRPAGDGLRLVYKGKAGQDTLLVILGVAIPQASRAGRNLPANVTVVREGSGQFFATQGDDKCFFDEATQEPVTGQDGRYRLRGRGYCTQPARAIGGADGAVLVSRFDVDAVVEYPKDP